MLKLFENRFINFENKFINTMKKLAISVEEEGVIDVQPGRGGEVDAVAVEKTGGGGGGAGLTRAGARKLDTTALSSACTTSVVRVTSRQATNSCPTSVATEPSLPGEAEQGLLDMFSTGRGGGGEGGGGEEHACPGKRTLTVLAPLPRADIYATGRDFEQASTKDDKTRKLEERIKALETQVSRLEHDVQSRDGRIVELEEFVAGFCNKARKLCKEKENTV